MAQAAEVTVVEVDGIVDTGELNPENIHTPGIFITRIIQVKEDPGFPRHPERNFWRA
jgi:3-oxoacid CoA-transferase subunit A